MFCEQCGTKLPEGAAFCTNCGTKISKSEMKKDGTQLDKDIQLKVKPIFKFGYMVLPAIIEYGIIIVLASVIVNVAIPGSGFITFLVGTGIISIWLSVNAIITMKQYENFSYDFYKTKVVFNDSFISISEKEVKYRHIKEVRMYQSFIQRYCNIGNIILQTNAETGYGNGIHIRNIENVRDVYESIKALIDV